MSGSMQHRHVVLVVFFAALALSCVFAAASDVSQGIYLKLDGINGGVGGCGQKPSTAGWIRVLTLQLGGQTIAPNNLWYITPPPGVKQITLTKETDSATPGLSAAFASGRTFPTAIINLCFIGPDGAVKKVGRYSLNSAVLSSFTATPPRETLVFTFAGVSTGVAAEPTARPTPSIRRMRAPATGREGIRLGPTATPTPPRY